MSRYDFYNSKGNYFGRFIKSNPEFACEEFKKFVLEKNKGDRDSGELEYVAKHEVLRLAYEFSEHRFRASNVFGEENDGFDKLITPLK